jgi:TolA-binding protein
VAEAYYKLGSTYEAMKQFEQARRAFETVIKNYTTTQYATLAQQGLVRVRDKND